jgi:hypothetical protein
VVPHEPHDLAAHLEVGYVGVEVEPVEALQVEGDVTVEDVVHVERLLGAWPLRRPCHHDHPHENSLDQPPGREIYATR